MAMFSTIYVVATGLKVIAVGFQLILLSLYRTQSPRSADGRATFARLVESEWALWAVACSAPIVIFLGVRCVFVGMKTFRTGLDLAYLPFAAMIMTGVILQILSGARGVLDLRTELIGSILVLGLPWIDGIEERVRRAFGSGRGRS